MSKFSHQLAAILLVCLSIPGLATSQTWTPSGTIEFITGAGAGTVHDRLARTALKAIQDGNLIPTAKMIVMNKPGAGGTIALGQLERGSSSVHSIATASGSILTSHAIGESKYNYTDFPLLSVVFTDYALFTVRADSPIKNGMDLVAKLKADPKSVSFAYATAPGNYSHIAIAGVAKAANADLKQVLLVVHTGGAKAMTEVLGGHVDVVVGGAGNVLGQIKAGKMRAIAISSPRRYQAPAMAQIPTWTEQGVNIVADTPYFILGEKNLKQEQVAFWERTFASVYQTPDWRKFIDQNNVVPLELNQAKGNEYLEERYNSYRASLKELGLAK